ncbi:MAG: hypothetical protein AAGC93_24355 [Cyanobacteria bacterium P01_F01_bin.53]
MEVWIMRLNIRLDLTSEQVRSRLLEGLDVWVKLGLLSDEQVRELAQLMSESLPTAEPVQSAESSPPSLFQDSAPASASQALAEQGSARRSRTRRPNQVSRTLRSLLDEISVIWLLFLGVFLVIISSGVLAATQWQSSSAVGQYAILFAYTLAFWGAGLWTRKQAKLQATSRMLVLTTLLLIPVNFWMMDAVGVLNTGLGKGAGAIAAIVLSCLPLQLLEQRINRINLIGLGWLHWSWVGSSFLGLVGGWPLWPVVATYLGTIGTAINLISQDRPVPVVDERDRSAEVNDALGGATDAGENATDLTADAGPDRPTPLSFDLLAVGLAILILLFRSLFIVQVPPHQLGLAAGICGWLLAWLNRNQPTKSLWQWAGYGLLLLGWAVSVTHQPPWQAVGVSLLGLWLLWDQLKRSWQSETVLALIGVAGQAYWLMGAVIPKGTRESILTQLSSQLSADPILKSEWTSLGFFPFLLGLLFFAWQLRRWQKPDLSRTTEGAALVLGGGLSALSLSNPFTAAANLLLSTAVLFTVVRKRPRIAEVMVSLTHIVGLSALVAVINYFWPDLSSTRWAYVGVGVGIAEFAAHVLLPGEQDNRWRRSTWAGGLGVFALTYVPLLDSWDGHPYWTWLLVPVVLTLVANHRRAIAPHWLARATAIALLFQLPWLTTWPMAIVSFAVGTACLLINSRVWPSLLSTVLAVGSGVALTMCVAAQGFIQKLEPGTARTFMTTGEERLLIVWAIAIWALWLIARVLNRRLGARRSARQSDRLSGRLSVLYERATRGWGTGLMVALLALGTLLTLIRWSENIIEIAPYFSYMVAATLLLMAALAESLRDRPTDWRYWSLAWAGGIVVTLGLMVRNALVGEIAIAFLALALITQIVGDLWVLRHPQHNWLSRGRSSWNGVPLIYAGLGLAIGHYNLLDSASEPLGVLVPDYGLQADTGLYTLFAAVVAMGVGRRKLALRPFSYIGLVAISVGAYELVMYQLMQASGGEPGDGLTILAALALVLAGLHKLFKPWLTRYGRLSSEGLSVVSYAHWALGSLGVLCAVIGGLSQPKGIALWTVTTLLLAGYALALGNRRWTPTLYAGGAHTGWTTLGLIQALLCVAYLRFEWFPDRDTLFSWGGVIACAIGLGLYAAPWSRWGWPAKPWRWLGLWLPMLTLSITLDNVTIRGLLIVGAFYAWMAKQFGQVRISYLSVFLFDWALLRYLDGQGLVTDLWVSLVFGLSVLYVVQVDPWLKKTSLRQSRHGLRILALGLIGLTALYQADISEPMLAYAALTLVLSISSVFAGLIFKIRAFLYVGTATFILQIVQVLWRSIGDHASLLWAVGIALGLLFIWVAATFESRRSQVINLLESWNAALQTWD